MRSGSCQPFGPTIAIVVGAGFVIGGIVTAAKGITKKYRQYLTIGDSSTIANIVCVYGLVARGVVFSTTGVLFAYAGFRVDPNEAGSMADALEWVRQLPFGFGLYIVTAAGLAAFGAYNFVEAGYRIVRTPTLASAKAALPVKG